MTEVLRRTLARPPSDFHYAGWKGATSARAKLSIGLYRCEPASWVPQTAKKAAPQPGYPHGRDGPGTIPASPTG
ncbi:MAG: hypothetical protein KatS3mg110_4111 [Pirellulaceae bacterium]|nr:MAG: hypothetical protein KatS3mg110_4111 [Pirellulaceae bacterium]